MGGREWAWVGWWGVEGFGAWRREGADDGGSGGVPVVWRNLGKASSSGQVARRS